MYGILSLLALRAGKGDRVGRDTNEGGANWWGDIFHSRDGYPRLAAATSRIAARPASIDMGDRQGGLPIDEGMTRGAENAAHMGKTGRRGSDHRRGMSLNAIIVRYRSRSESGEQTHERSARERREDCTQTGQRGETDATGDEKARRGRSGLEDGLAMRESGGGRALIAIRVRTRTQGIHTRESLSRHGTTTAIHWMLLILPPWLPVASRYFSCYTTRRYAAHPARPRTCLKVPEVLKSQVQHVAASSAASSPPLRESPASKRLQDHIVAMRFGPRIVPHGKRLARLGLIAAWLDRLAEPRQAAALYAACYATSLATATLLLEKGADPNLQDVYPKVVCSTLKLPENSGQVWYRPSGGHSWKKRSRLPHANSIYPSQY
ncbi:hypothetical protein DFH09DRAFT_1277351 [Mycena vulgaris]|nr:hypothetical protein DFH09DRAFT_1277351 [Mycena vulgaris]